MAFNVDAESVEITPSGHRNVSLSIDCDLSDLLSDVTIEQMVNEKGYDELLDHIGEEAVKEYFGLE